MCTVHYVIPDGRSDYLDSANRWPTVFLIWLAVLVALQVAEALGRLRAREGGLTATAMAAIDQDELASILRSVHWNKVRTNDNDAVTTVTW